MSVLPNIVWPIPANNRGSEFGNQEEILSHLDGESTGSYLIGRNGMWHGGIHITNATTPWCALSGNTLSEGLDFPTAYKGEQAVRCMADGEVVAYRICKDYLRLAWETGPLSFSGSFLLVRHYIQPGETEKSGLRFYTLYMHLAPYSAYDVQADQTLWTAQASLSAYDPEWVLVASTDNKTISESYRVGTLPKGAIIEWDQSNAGLHTTAFNQREYGLVTLKGLSDAAQQQGFTTSLKPGQQCWILVDKNNIAPGTDGVVQPAWWKHLQPPAKEAMQFDKVVSPTPYPIRAGDPIGHLGYYQAAKDGGHEPRYQVHIECMSMDDNLPHFLTNPEKAGQASPLYLKYSPGLALYRKDFETGTFVQDDRVTTRTGILTLSQVTTDTDKSTQQEYWYLRPEVAYVPKGQAELKLLSQYDLEELGFNTAIENPSSFDYLDGKTQPTGLVRKIFEALLDASKRDTRTSHAMVKYNYQRLLKMVDSGSDYYFPQEYYRGIHNSDYREVVQKMIVKHPSDWYFKKDDAIWQTFLNPLKKEAPEWKQYGEEFLDHMAWMQGVTTETLGPSLWHMHPIMFLVTLREVRVRGWAHSPFADLLGSVESKNDYTAYNRTWPHPNPTHSEAHYKTNLTSMTIHQVMKAQSRFDMFATGRFQIIPSTLKEAVKKLNLDLNSLYDETMQDRIFEEYLIKHKRKPIIGYLEGNGSVEDAIYAWALEFASAGVRKGKTISKGRTAHIEGISYYSGDGLNRSHIMPDEMVAILEESRNEIR